jgi:hypothetical protein
MSSTEPSIFGSSSPSSIMSEPTDNSSEKQSVDPSAPASPPIERTELEEDISREQQSSEQDVSHALKQNKSATGELPNAVEDNINPSSEAGKAAQKSDNASTIPTKPTSERVPPTLQGLPHELLVEICSRVSSVRTDTLSYLSNPASDKSQVTFKESLCGKPKTASCRSGSALSYG